MRKALLYMTLPISLLGACASGKGSVDDDDDGVEIGDADDVADLCEGAEPELITLAVSFPAPSSGCDFGEDGNLEENNGYVTADNLLAIIR